MTKTMVLTPDSEEYAIISAAIEQHKRLNQLLEAGIKSLGEPAGDLWVGMGTDEVLLKGDSLNNIIEQFKERGIEDGTTVVEFLSAEPEELVL